MAAGTMPSAITAPTVAAAASTSLNASSIVATLGGLRVRRTATRVAMPNMPSEPTNAPRRS